IRGRQRSAHDAIEPDLRRVLARPVALAEMQSQCAVLGVLFHRDAQLGLEDVADALAALEATCRAAAPGDERAVRTRQAEFAVEGRSAEDARLTEPQLPRDDAHRDAGDVAISMLDG